MANNPRTIFRAGFRGLRREAIVAAGQTISPGMLIDLDSTGKAIVHATAAGSAVKRVAIENEMAGKDPSTAYTAGETCFYVVPLPGEEVNLKLGASAAAITAGNFLDSAGDGTVKAQTGGTAVTNASRAGLIAQALESQDNSGGAGTDHTHIASVIV